MENKQEKTAAELYREERKQRMAKAAKKNAKRSPQLGRAGRALGKCFIVVVIAAVCLAVIYGCLDFTGVLQRNIMTAMKVGSTKVSVAEYNYYYMQMYSQLASTAKQYDNNYGAGSGKTYLGYDTSVSPDKQSYTMSEIEGITDPTWADYFDDTAKQQIQLITAFSKLGRDAGIELTDEQKETIDSTIESYSTTASSNDFSLNRFLVKNFGKGVNEKLMRRILEDQSIAQTYAEQQEKKISDGISDEQINEEFSKNPQNYTKFSIGLFKVTADIPEDATDEQKEAAMAEAKAKADSIIAGVSDTASFVAAATAYDNALTSESVITSDTTAASISNYVESAVEWIYADGRAVGDKSVFEVSDGYYLVYMVTLPHRDTTKGVDVRHILIQFENQTDDDGNTVELTDEQKAEYMAQAQAIYNTYLENPTEENFAALAKEHSADGGSSENGGLYEDIYPDTNFVKEFLDWCFEDSRAAGDTGIIESTYGYHIMYYVGNDNPEAWANTIKETLSENLTNSLYEDTKNNADFALDVKNNNVKWAQNALNKYIGTTLITSA